MMNGSKTLLRIPDLTDVPFMLGIENDKRYWHLSGTTEPYTEEELQDFVTGSTANLQHDKQVRFVIFDIASKQRAGLIDVFEYDAQNSRAGLGVLIIDEYRNKGLAGDAIHVLLQYLFEVLNLHQVWANVLHDNEASIKLFTAAGFEITCIKKEWIFFNNKFHDEVLMQCLNRKHSL